MKTRFYVVDPVSRKTFGKHFTSFASAKSFQIQNALIGITQIWSYNPNEFKFRRREDFED